MGGGVEQQNGPGLGVVQISVGSVQWFAIYVIDFTDEVCNIERLDVLFSKVEWSG